MSLGLGLGISRTQKYTGKLPGDSVVVLFGDSLEAHNNYASATAGAEGHSVWGRGYYSWCRMLAPMGRWDTWYDAAKTGRYFQGQNQGLSGDTTALMAARKSDVTNIPGVKVVIQGGGTNDIYQGVPVATILANHAACLAEWKARGIRTILLTPPPRPTSGTSSWPAGGSMRLAWMDLCAGMQAMADADPRWVQIVRRDLICSNNNADRTPKTGHIQTDNVHLTPIGGYHVAADAGGLIEKLGKWVASFTGFPPLAPAGEYVPNPILSGSGGLVTAPCSGNAPDGMWLRRSSGTNITATGSRETVNGEDAFKLTLTRNGAGGTETITLDLGADITAGLPSAGSWLRHAIRLKASASPAIQSAYLQAREQPSTPANMNVYTMRYDTGYLWENAMLQNPAGGLVWQISPPWQWRSGGTSIIFGLAITLDNSTAGTDTIWISRMHLFPVADPRPSLGF